MTIRKIEVERLTIVSSRTFEAVVAAVENAIGRPDMREFGKASNEATSYARLESLVNRSVSQLGLMLFMSWTSVQYCARKVVLPDRKLSALSSAIL